MDTSNKRAESLAQSEEHEIAQHGKDSLFFNGCWAGLAFLMIVAYCLVKWLLWGGTFFVSGVEAAIMAVVIGAPLLFGYFGALQDKSRVLQNQRAIRIELKLDSLMQIHAESSDRVKEEFEGLRELVEEATKDEIVVPERRIPARLPLPD